MPRTSMARALEVAKNVETLSKPVAIVLAVIGLIAFDFPGITRWWQELTAPAAWYQVGAIRRSSDGTGLAFASNSYDSPVWNGTFRPEILFELPGKEILTNDTAIGRHEPDLDAEVETALDKRVCLHVVDLAFADYQPPKERQGTPIYLKDLGGDAAARLRTITRASNPANGASCQPLKPDEWAAYATRRAKEDPPVTLPAYDKARPVCPRTVVWVRAQRVSC